ncbi:hypothetical protein GAR06_00232 [Micromonospora saelicesensis]|uniref:Uncharacterized protein n=2 Tax=Micromonospora saelicesensis TaxID=285676 RepID=A0A1C4WN63_9ACTN|nr:hypothetical protein [Micromonospora saelicesensis]RAN92252.1 hypothetical protein GAR05_06243 [Micromonospora saelicesensis]RAO45990.1 hypothetical protein PSN01_05182 [Micromonospora saelicesensis]RAO50315.1 hypothetical protein GAR06_00232 [Micromonospora saelicesensis]RAO51767.1 hypothetical protein LUPAC06_06452 [Micromonospora saelicesensis]SCE97598.1 hypothetical protein GA0070561_2861 [Micromonospora saelicesensis]
MEIAVIWIPAHIEPSEPAVARCLSHLRRHSYRFTGIMRASWETVEQMMIDGEVDVVVIADFAHLPPDRSPRIELANSSDGVADEDRTVPDTQLD